MPPTYLTAAAIRAAVPALEDAQKFPDQVLEDLIEEFEEVAEEYRGVAFTPRAETERFRLDQRFPIERSPTLVGAGSLTTGFRQPRVLLKWPLIRSITSVTQGGTTVSASSYDIDAQLGALIYQGVGFDSELVVAYSHGMDSPPRIALRACREYVRSCALQDRSSVPRDVIGQTFEGSYTRYSTPDKDAGRPTGWLEVDRLLNSLPNYRVPGVG